MSRETTIACIILLSALAIGAIGAFPHLIDLFGVDDWVNWYYGTTLLGWMGGVAYLDATWLFPRRMGHEYVPYQALVTKWRWEKPAALRARIEAGVEAAVCERCEGWGDENRARARCLQCNSTGKHNRAVKALRGAS